MAVEFLLDDEVGEADEADAEDEDEDEADEYWDESILLFGIFLCVKSKSFGER